MSTTHGNRLGARVPWRLPALFAFFLTSLPAVHGAQSQEQLALMTKGKLAADLGNYAVATDAFSSVANDSSVPAPLRSEALVRLGLARSRAGDTRGSLEAFKTVITRYSSDRSAVRFATGAIAAGVPGKIWPEFRTQLEELLRTANVLSVAYAGMPQSSPKIVRLKWDDFEVRGVWKSGGDPGQGTTSRSHSAEFAAYEIDKMVGLNMVPPTVARSIEEQPGALQFWVNGVRVYKHVQDIPKTPHWSRQLSRMQLFDNLIGNSGRVLSNMMVDRDDNLMLVDYMDSFSADRTLKDPPLQFDRRLVEKLRALDTTESRIRLKNILSDGEIEDLLARRNALLVHLDKLIAERGEAAVFF